VRDIDTSHWTSLMTRVGIWDAARDKLNKAFGEIFAEPAVASLPTEAGAAHYPSSREDVTAMLVRLCG